MNKYKTLKLDQILIEDRLREIDEDEASAIASSIAINGQQQPVVVRATNAAKRPYTLVIGGHRIRALELLGRTEVDAKIENLDKDAAKLAEIDENLFRADLTALDKAIFLAERKKIHERLHPETKNGGDRGNQHTGGKKRQNDKDVVLAENQNDKDVDLKFTADTADKLGLGERSIERAVMIAKNLTPDTIKALRGTREANNASRLLKLARMEPAAQKVAINLFNETSDLAAAIIQAEGGKQVKKKPDAELKYEALVSTWKHAPKKSREQFVALVSDELKAMMEEQK